MKKMPYGISNYEELVNDNYYYVDKTIYIEKLENLAEKRTMFLRPPLGSTPTEIKGLRN